jgi:hypothetical protein
LPFSVVTCTNFVLYRAADSVPPGQVVGLEWFLRNLVGGDLPSPGSGADSSHGSNMPVGGKVPHVLLCRVFRANALFFYAEIIYCQFSKEMSSSYFGLVVLCVFQGKRPRICRHFHGFPIIERDKYRVQFTCKIQASN